MYKLYTHTQTHIHGMSIYIHIIYKAWNQWYITVIVLYLLLCRKNDITMEKAEISIAYMIIQNTMVSSLKNLWFIVSIELW